MSSPVAASAVAARRFAAARPSLPWVATGLLAGGVLVLVAGIALVVVPARRTAGTPPR